MQYASMCMFLHVWGYIYAYMYVCTWDLRFGLRISLHHPSTSLIELGSLQSSLYLTDMTSHLALRIPCLCLPGLELKGSFHAQAAFVWVLGI